MGSKSIPKQVDSSGNGKYPKRGDCPDMFAGIACQTRVIGLAFIGCIASSPPLRNVPQ